MMLVMNLVPVADSITLDAPVPTKIEDRWQWLLEFFGPIEVCRNV